MTVIQLGSQNSILNFAKIIGSIAPEYDADLFERIHQGPSFLPHDVNEDTLREIFLVTVVITLIHLAFLQLVKAKYHPQRKKSSENGAGKSLAAWKISYQLTNLIVNLSLGCAGIYHELSVSHANISAMNKIAGFVDCRYFAIGQIGYQIWALPVGILVGETRSMIVHHISVICVASGSAFLTCGFRYFNPYFYGVIEISSVPLSVMNAFKDNPDLINDFPDIYTKVRLIFGLTFLLVRVVLWTPFYWDFITLAMMLLHSSVGSTKFLLAIFNLSSLILSLLQYIWASKIISALLKMSSAKAKFIKME